MSKLSKKIIEGLENILAYEKEKLDLHSTEIEIPNPPKVYKAKDIREIRENRNYSQGIFAKILNVSPKTIQAWESGRRNPTQSALRLLEIIDMDIYSPKIKR